MSTTAKVILGIVAALVIICALVGVGGFLLFRSAGQKLASSVQTDPAKTADIAKSIADFTLPNGFGSPYATNIAGFTLVAYNGEDGHSHIYFFQVPSNVQLDQQQIEQQMKNATQTSTPDKITRTKVVEQKTVTIRGQETTLLISEGTNHEGQLYREASGMFQGKGGQAMVLISRPAENWDQAAIDQFFASIQ